MFFFGELASSWDRLLCQDKGSSPRSYEERSPRNTSNKPTRPSHVGGFSYVSSRVCCMIFFGNDVSHLEIENRNEVLMTSMACFVIEISAFVSMADGRCQ